MGFDFNLDGPSFGLGVGAGLGISFAIYQARHLIGSMRRSVEEQAASAQSAALRSADRRYINFLAQTCQQSHLLGLQVNLTDILVEPRFITAPSPVDVPDEDDLPGVFDVVPRIHDFPYLYAPYNIETLSIDELGRGERALALLGLPGSGRTTALLAIALWTLSAVDFKPAGDRVQAMLDAEFGDLRDDERVQRMKDALMIEERARQQVAKERGEEYVESDGRSSGLSVFRQLVPIYVHMADLLLDTDEYGQDVDPAEPLVRALQYRAGGVTAKTLPGFIYRRLAAGQALLLIDGYDDLPADERPTHTAWLQALLDLYASNFIIVAGPAAGYGDLSAAGFTPVFLRPWNDVDIAAGVESWARSWKKIATRRSSEPEPDLIEQLKGRSRALPAVDVALQTWHFFHDPASTAGRDGWVRSYITRLFPAAEEKIADLSELAVLQTEEGFITQQRLVELALGTTPVSAAAELSADDESLFETSGSSEAEDLEAALFGDETAAAPSPPAEPAMDDMDPTDPKVAKRIAKEKAALLQSLQKSGLLVAFRGGRFRFRHGMVAAYLASLRLVNAAEETLVEKAADSRWLQVLAYASTHTPIDAAVRVRLEAPADMLHENTLEVARWLAYAGPRAAWRGELLTRLGNMFVAPAQYPLLRERIATALVGTRIPAVLGIFNKAVTRPQLDVRRLSSLALGAIGSEEAINHLARVLESGAESELELAAGLALGAIGTQEALDVMLDALATGSEQLRRAVAEAFAAIPDTGHPILYEAVNHDEGEIRRAAIFGLRRIRTNWALTTIYRRFMEDPDWRVRSAAQEGLQGIQLGETGVVRAYPGVESLPWLLGWAREMGDALPQNADGYGMLQMALQEGEVLYRSLAALASGQLGLLDNVRGLYEALYDEHDVVREAAHRALADLQQRLGTPLPAPV